MAVRLPSSESLAELNSQVDAEIADPEHQKRAHGRPSTRRAGCQGPLCEFGTKAYEREKQRKVRNASKPRPKYVPTSEDVQLQKRLTEYLANRTPGGYNY